MRSTCWTSALLTAIISHSDRQLLGNKLSFALCSIHILFNSNKFHKFWMSFDFRRTHAKRGRIWVKTQADRPILGQPAWHPYTLSHDFDPGAMSGTQMYLSRGLDVGLMYGPKGLHKDQRTHNSVQSHVQVSNPHPGVITSVKTQHRWNGGTT